MLTKNLTPKQQRFVEEYLIDLCATQAAVRAGYSQKSAKEQGYENLTKPHIAAAIAEAQQARADRTEISQTWVLERLVSVAERTMQAKPVLDKLGNPRGEFTFQAAGAVRALELIGKHLGMFSGKLSTQQHKQSINDYTEEELLEIIRADEGGNGATAPGTDGEDVGTDQDGGEVPERVN